MQRTLTVKRLYSTGQYQHIEFTDTVSDIPDELALDAEYISRLSNLMLLRVEAQFHKYRLIQETIGSKSPQSVYETLEDVIANQTVQLFTQTKE